MAQYYRAPPAGTATAQQPSTVSAAVSPASGHIQGSLAEHGSRQSQPRSKALSVTRIGRVPSQTRTAVTPPSIVSSVATPPELPINSEPAKYPARQGSKVRSGQVPIAASSPASLQPVLGTDDGQLRSSQRSIDSAHNMATLRQSSDADEALASELEEQVSLDRIPLDRTHVYL